MSPGEVELWMVERQKNYRMFGFAAAVLERVPLFGLVFSISNRIGAAMYAHDVSLLLTSECRHIADWECRRYCDAAREAPTRVLLGRFESDEGLRVKDG